MTKDVGWYPRLMDARNSQLMLRVQNKKKTRLGESLLALWEEVLSLLIVHPQGLVSQEVGMA